MKSFKLFLFGLLFLCSCSSDSEVVSLEGTLTGSVSDKSTGEPVPTVIVALNPGGQTTVTGSDGSFNFPRLDAGTYTVNLTKEGYNPTSGRFTVKEGQVTTAHLLIERIPSTITPDRDVLDFGDIEGVTTLSFAIVNTNYADLEYGIEYSCKWIKKIHPEEGTLRTGKTETIIVEIDREQLNGGDNETVLVIRTSNGRSEVTVKAIGKSLPKLNILEATEVKATTAVLNGKIVNAGTPAYTERGFVYSNSTEPTLESTLAKVSAPISADNEYSCTVNRLTLGETYYVRAYAINELGVVYSNNETSFTTQPYAPEVTIQEASDVNVVTGVAMLYGTIVDMGYPAATEHGFVYSQFNTPTVDDVKIVSTSTGAGAYMSTIDNLPLDIVLYARAYIISELGIFYSPNHVTVSTKAAPPQVFTDEAIDVDLDAGYATLVGHIDYEGAPAYTERGFVYSTIGQPTTNDNKVVVSGGGTGSFSAFVTHLPSEKNVYVRAYAIGSRVGTIYGEEIIIEKKDWIELESASIAVQREDQGDWSWENANRHCEQSIVGGYTDWRLPTINELIVMYTNMEYLGCDEYGFYWSSTPCYEDEYGVNYYWVFFKEGTIYEGGNYGLSRCVRTIEATE